MWVIHTYKHSQQEQEEQHTRGLQGGHGSVPLLNVKEKFLCASLQLVLFGVHYLGQGLLDLPYPLRRWSVAGAGRQ